MPSSLFPVGILLSFYAMFIIYILCFLCRTIAPVATVICWPYPTLNKSCLVLSCLALPVLSCLALPYLTLPYLILSYQSSATLTIVRGIHRSPVNFPYQGKVTRKMFPFDDVIISWLILIDNFNRSAIFRNWMLQSPVVNLLCPIFKKVFLITNACMI